MGMTQVLFKNEGECLEKLKELGILSKTKEISDLSTILYKKAKLDNEIESFSCKVIGFNYKENADNCINKTYENLIVKVNNSTFNINPEYLRDMQSKSWGKKDDVITSNPVQRDDVGIFVHLVTGPKKGVIIKLKNMKMNFNIDILTSTITKCFNKAINSNYTKEYIMSHYYANTYTKIQYNKDFSSFNLIKNLSECSLNHLTKNYIFIEENMTVAEINSKNHKRVVAIDFETANSQRASVCSIGFVVQENNQIIFEKEILVNPKEKFSKRNIKIHNITEDDVIDAPLWPDAWSEVCEYITESTLVVAHNLRSMELPCIRKECERYDMEIPEFAMPHSKNTYDTLKLSRDLFDDMKNYKLSTLAEKFDIELDHHNALSDARACLKLFNTLKTL